MEDIPEYLFHYTSVDSLALILKNRTIRLNSLNKMDDLQEQISQDEQNFGKFVFVSSWTAEEKESIPMWRMYTPKQRGVRIKLKSNPFMEYFILSSFKTIVPITDVFNKNGFSIINNGIKQQLFEIKYTNDNNLLKPSILKIVDNKFEIKLNDVGIYKNDYWNFQKEWRYRLLFSPISFPTLIRQTQGQNIEMAKIQQLIINGQAALPFNHYDLNIRNECFDDISIMLAPDISEASKILVQLLVKEFCPHCTMNASELTKLIQ